MSEKTTAMVPQIDRKTPQTNTVLYYEPVAPSIGRGAGQVVKFVAYWTGVAGGGLLLAGLKATTYCTKIVLVNAGRLAVWTDKKAGQLLEAYETGLMESKSKPRLPDGLPDADKGEITHHQVGQVTHQYNIDNRGGQIFFNNH